MNKLVIDEKYYNTLDINGFLAMMNNPTCSYKFYWLEAITNLIAGGKVEASYDEIINEMIVSAWYPVLEYHIHLSGLDSKGKIKDNLEKAVLRLKEMTDLSAKVDKEEILRQLEVYHAEKDLKNIKSELTKYVPYRALSGFAGKGSKAINMDKSAGKLVEAFNRLSQSEILLPYTFGLANGMKRKLIFSDGWVQMIQDNASVILGWIQNEKIKWLQKNNPEVPGMVYKMAPEGKKRQLEKVKKLWLAILDNESLKDIFNGNNLLEEQYEIDHFIPWSFVMNDELWNLMPINAELNLAKSNKLPLWENFFCRFAKNQFVLYKRVHSNEKIHMLYEKCFQDNLHSIWAIKELYLPGNNQQKFQEVLEKNMRPVYDSALRQGYEIWDYR